MTSASDTTDGDLVARPSAGRVFERRWPVRLADVSPGGRMRLDAAARHLQDLSADDTADSALEDAQAWVVRKTVIEMRTSPRYLEPLRLATWCSGTGSHWAERRISIVGEQSGAIEATTTWVHFDHETGRPKRVPASFDALYGEASGGRRVKARLAHPAPPDGAPSRPWPLRFTDFDVLDHVNNAAYWEAVEEELAPRKALRAPLRAEMEHHRAVERGDDVQLVVIDVDAADESAGFDLWLTVDGQVAASAQVRPLSR